MLYVQKCKVRCYVLFVFVQKASRLLSLFTKDGLDDMFSSDFTDEELNQKFGHIKDRWPICLAFSVDDEYVPDFVDVRRLGRRLGKLYNYYVKL